MKINDLTRVPKLTESLSGDDIESLPGYDEDAEFDYISKVAVELQITDPNNGEPLLTAQDLMTIGMIGYRALLINEPRDKVLADINDWRNMFYLARMGLKYPHETANDPKYQEAIESMLEAYHMAFPDYDPISDTELGPRN